MNSIDFNGLKVTPSKLICIGRNYVEHIKELNNEMPSEMVIFLKPNSSVTNELIYFGKNYRYEGELCFLIKEQKIVGVGFGLDLTNKEAQEYAKSKGLPWERAKAFDNSAPLSNFIKIEDSNLKDLSFKLFINNSLAQEGDYNLMIHKPDDILKETKSFLTLQDYDIIMSGTPKGVGSYNIGDIFEAKIYLNDKEILTTTFKAK